MAITEQLKNADENTTDRVRWFARLYLLALISLVILALGSLIYFDYITVALTLSGTINIAWIVEYVVLGLAGLLLLFTASMVVKAVGGSTVASVINVVRTVADNYQIDRSDIDQSDEE